MEGIKCCRQCENNYVKRYERVLEKKQYFRNQICKIDPYSFMVIAEDYRIGKKYYHKF